MSSIPDVAARARALWYVAPGEAGLRDESLRAPGEGEVRVRTRWSAVSRGTERLVRDGRVPPSEFARMRAPMQAGDFPFPVKYGYACVGTVEHGPESLLGREVFVLHPHQDVFVAPADAVLPVPPQVPPRRAVLAANAETALNACWDAGVLPGMRVAVVGGGTVGALVAWLVARVPGTEVVVVDPRREVETLARALGAAWAPPEAAPAGCDLVVHASATDAGLATALAAAGDEATVLELSWYGERRVQVPLGDAFHAARLRLVSSQVGRVAPAMRGRWTHRRRLAAALALLDDPRLDALLAPDLRFDDGLPAALASTFSSNAGPPCPVIAYG
ncbi:MAG: zinc-binding alcohol dehydrogenase [Burkholderiales bacterium]